jgi:peptidoglycan hydrolase-like protein with peptidoglycan-binding domain
MTGSDVEKLQQKLQELGFYSGPIDGLFGQGVEQAVKDYEDSRLLPLINSLLIV